MALVLTSGPASEPVTLAEAKAHMRIETTAEDVLIASLLLTARLHVEQALNAALITQSFRLILDEWPEDRAFDLPVAPVNQIDEIRVLAADGTPAVIASTAYGLEQSPTSPRLYRRDTTWPPPGQTIQGIEIDLTAGYGAAPSDVPQPIRHAILLLTAHWYEHRDPYQIGHPSANTSSAVSDLLKPYARVRL